MLLLLLLPSITLFFPPIRLSYVQEMFSSEHSNSNSPLSIDANLAYDSQFLILAQQLRCYIQPSNRLNASNLSLRESAGVCVCVRMRFSAFDILIRCEAYWIYRTLPVLFSCTGTGTGTLFPNGKKTMTIVSHYILKYFLLILHLTNSNKDTYFVILFVIYICSCYKYTAQVRDT